MVLQFVDDIVGRYQAGNNLLHTVGWNGCTDTDYGNLAGHLHRQLNSFFGGEDECLCWLGHQFKKKENKKSEMNTTKTKNKIR